MSDASSTSSPSTRTVTAFFDTGEQAAQAKVDLIAAGVPAAAITLLGDGATDSATVAQPKGFWESLADFFMPDEDRHKYTEGLRRGGFAVAVQTQAALYDTAIDVLDRDGAIDLDERVTAWEGDDWSPAAAALGQSPIDAAYVPASPSTAGFGASRAGEDGIVAADEMDPSTADGPHPSALAAGEVSGRADPDGLFGRRDLTHGRSRVRSYIVAGNDDR